MEIFQGTETGQEMIVRYVSGLVRYVSGLDLVDRERAQQPSCIAVGNGSDIYHQPNYGSELEIYSDSESESDKSLRYRGRRIVHRGDFSETGDVSGLDLVSGTKILQSKPRIVEAKASVIYHKPNYGSESEIYPDSESESDKCLDSDVCPRVDVQESLKTSTEKIARDVHGLDLVSHTKVGEVQECNTALDTHLIRHEDIRMLAAAKTSSIVYRKRNYGSESDKCSDSDVCPRVDIGESWKTGLLDCHQDITIAAGVALCPCVAFGQIAEVLHDGEMTCPMGSFIYLLMVPLLCSQRIIGSMYRKKLRRKLNLEEYPSEDWDSHMFCHYCSLCQEYRELQIRGLDPSLGWKGILARQQGMQKRSQDLVQCPPRTQAMSK